MLLYHIADTHFGKSINGASLLEDQRYWVNRFIEKCDENRPDAIYHAGMDSGEIIKYAKRKVLLPISDYLDYMPNLKKLLEEPTQAESPASA